KKNADRPSCPKYHFTVHGPMNQRIIKSVNDIELTTTVKISVIDDDKKPVAQEPFTFQYANKTTDELKTDKNGVAEIKKVAIGNIKIQFKRDPFIAPEQSVVVDNFKNSLVYDLDIFKENKFFACSCVVKCSHIIKDHYRFVLNPPYYAIVQSFDTKHIQSNDTKYKSDILSLYLKNNKKLTEKNNTAVVQKTSEAGIKRWDMDCMWSNSDNTANPFLPDFWRQLYNPQELSVSGLRDPLSVKLYKPDQYSLSLKFPPIRRFQSGIKLAKQDILKKGIGKSNETKDLSPEDVHESKSWKIGTDLATIPFSGDKPVIYKVNSVERTISGLSALGSLVRMITAFQKIIQAIKDNIPEAGIYVDMQFKLFEGLFKYEWGWKEYKDHRAFMRMAAIVDITLIGISFELGVGVSGFSIKLQVFALLKSNLTISFNGERVSPENTAEISFPIKTTADASVGARFEALYIVKIEGTVTTGIEIKGFFKISTREGPSLNASITWTGIKANITVSANVAKSAGTKEPEKKFDGKTSTIESTKRERVLVDAVPLGVFQWPSQEKYAPLFIPREKVVAVIDKVFREGSNLCVHDEKNNEIDLKTIVNRMADYIDKRKNVNRTEETVRIFALAVRNRMKELYTRPAWSLFKSLAFKDYTNFCNTEIKQHLDKMVDQGSDLVAKLDTH
ncbi:MAG TPA: hypothetical protein VKO63_07095, partial [Chitinispirillaceae bacterium]|nr:hypothetical protein [Chitinispirillaceae bacterium]